MVVETRAKRQKLVRITTWANVEYAEAVFIEILSRLPLKSIRSFRAVNKHWYAAITNRYFARKQFDRSREKPMFITCPNVDSSMELYSMKLGSFRKFHVNSIDPAEKKTQEFMYMISSFNGLICCVSRESNRLCDLRIWIVNPFTKETLLLPQGRHSLYNFEPSVGVAYGPSYYKVFRIFCVGRKVPEELFFDGHRFQNGQLVAVYRYKLLYECELYSSITGEWKNIGVVPCVPMYSHLSPFRSCHVFVGGKIYWLSSLDDEGEILCVDLEGKFEVIHLPWYDPNLKEEDGITVATYLISLRGCLSVVVLHPDYMDVWIRNNESWILVCQDTSPIDVDDNLVLAMTSLNNQIICVTEEKWYSYNMDARARRWKKTRTNPDGFVNPTVYIYTESCVPCTGML